MYIDGKVVVVTGGGHGIGRALCRRFAVEGAHGVVVADIDADAARRVASETGGLAVAADVANEADMHRLVGLANNAFGQIDLFCSNAGIAVDGGPEVPDFDWDRIWHVNVMGHVYATRAVLPQMLARGEGYLLQTVSAAGLLSQIGSAPYSVTKHAALGFAEWLSITYYDAGIRVSALCPQGVKTDMLLDSGAGAGHFLTEGALEPEQVADSVLQGLAQERFLILPHPEVATYFQRKASDYDRWLRGMRRLQQRLMESNMLPSLKAKVVSTTMQQPVWNFEQEPWDRPHDETDVNLRAYFDRMRDEKMLQYRPEWTDEQVVEWDGNFKLDDEAAPAELMLGCSEREVFLEEYRQVLDQAIAYRSHVRTDTQPA